VSAINLNLTIDYCLLKAQCRYYTRFKTKVYRSIKMNEIYGVQKLNQAYSATYLL